MALDGYYVSRNVTWVWARVCSHEIHYVHETRQEARDKELEDYAASDDGWCGPHRIVKLVQSPKATK